MGCSENRMGGTNGFVLKFVGLEGNHLHSYVRMFAKWKCIIRKAQIINIFIILLYLCETLFFFIWWNKIKCDKMKLLIIKFYDL